MALRHPLSIAGFCPPCALGTTTAVTLAVDQSTETPPGCTWLLCPSLMPRSVDLTTWSWPKEGTPGSQDLASPGHAQLIQKYQHLRIEQVLDTRNQNTASSEAAQNGKAPDILDPVKSDSKPAPLGSPGPQQAARSRCPGLRRLSGLHGSRGEPGLGEKHLRRTQLNSPCCEMLVRIYGELKGGSLITGSLCDPALCVTRCLTLCIYFEGCGHISLAPSPSVCLSVRLYVLCLYTYIHILI